MTFDEFVEQVRALARDQGIDLSQAEIAMIDINSGQDTVELLNDHDPRKIVIV